MQSLICRRYLELKVRGFNFLEVISKEKSISYDKIFVSSREILRQDERKQESHMRANGKDIAKRKFCKAEELDPRTVGRDFDFVIIEENF